VPLRHLPVIAIVCVAACGGPADDSRSTPVLIGSDQIATDTIEALLIGNQRDLLSAIARGDTAALSRLIFAEFTSHDVRVPESTPISLHRGNRPQLHTYLEVLAGGLGDRVASEYSTFHARPRDGSATVYAFGADHAIQTAWRYGPAGWKASQMILLRPEDARTMMELVRK
jgi:hypothetical protein